MKFQTKLPFIIKKYIKINKKELIKNILLISILSKVKNLFIKNIYIL